MRTLIKTCVLTLILTTQISAQEAIITTTLAATEVSDLIEQAKNSASTLLGEAESRGSALLNQAGNELNVLAANASVLLSNQLDKTVGDLSAQSQQLMVRLDRLTNSTDNFLSQDIYDLKDAVALDLTQALSGIPFYGDKLFISRVSGLTHIFKEDGNYKLDIIGTNLGLGDNKVTTQIAITIDSTKIDDFKINRASRNESDILIPVEYLNDSTDYSSKIVLIEVKFSVKKKFLFLIPYTKKESFSIPINVSILSRKAGELTTHFTSSEYGWERERTEKIDRSTANHHCSKKCKGEPTRTNYTINYSVSRSNTNPPTPGDRKLQNIRLNCINGPCGAWNAVMSLNIRNNKTNAVASFDVWSHPTTWRMTIDVDQYQETQELITSENSVLMYDEIIKIETPANFKYGKFIFKTISNKQVEVLLGSEDDEGLISLENIQNLANGRKLYFYKANKQI